MSELMSRLQIADQTGMQNRAAIGPGPYTDAVPEWPTYGYDGSLDKQHHDDYKNSGRTREEWLTVANTMIDRWLEWRAWCEYAPDHLFKETP